MKSILIGTAAVGLFFAGSAMAGPGGTSCANAEELFAATTVSGDTSAAGYGNNTNSFGTIPSPANDAYYYFVAKNVSPTSNITMTPGYDAGIALTKTCGNNAPQEHADGGSGTLTLNLALGGGGPLVDGTTYYVIVTGNPTGDASNVGSFSLTTPTPLPVKLQKFSVQ